MNKSVRKTVVEIDLKGYSEIVREVEEFCQKFRQQFGCDDLNLLPFINGHIQNFIDKGLEAINKKREDVVQATNGDNAVIILDNADEAYKFAKAVHKATQSHNDKQTEVSAQRRFRIGAATGELVENYDAETLTGYTIVKAYRLEADAEPGKYFVVDVETHNSFSPEIRKKFGDEETVNDKNKNQFQAHRCKIIYDNLLEYFEQLNDREKQLVYQIGLESGDKAPDNSEDNLQKLVEQELIIEHKYGSVTRFTLADNFNDFFQEIIIQAIVKEISTKKEEISTNKLDILKDYSILKILKREDVPKLLQEELLTTLQSQDGNSKFGKDIDDKSKLGEHIHEIFCTLRQQHHYNRQLLGNYVAGNLINLLLQLDLRKDFRYYDLSNISIWNADLTKAILTGVDFSKSDLEKSKFSQPLGCIHAIAFDADGKYFATGDAHGSIRVHNTETLELCGFNNERGNQIWSVAFGKNEKHNQMLAWGAEDGSVTLREIAISSDNKMKLIPIQPHPENWTTRILSVAFSPDGNTLAIGGDGDNAIHFLKINHSHHQDIYLNGHEQNGTLNAHNVSCMTFINDDCIASGNRDGEINLWHIEQTNRKQDLSRKVHEGVVRCITFNPKADILASGGEDGKLKILYLQQYPRQFIEIEFETKISQVRTLAFSKDGNILAVGCIDNNPNEKSEHKIRLWNLSEKKWIDTLEGHEHSIRSLAFSPKSDDVQLLVSGGDGRTVKLWNRFWDKEKGVWKWKCKQELMGYANRIWSVAFSRDGESKTFACGGEDNQIHIWNYHERTHIPCQTLSKHDNWVWSVAFNPKADILASCGEDNQIYLWQLQEGEWRYVSELSGNDEIKRHNKRVRCIAFHPQGGILASAGNDNRIILWDVTDITDPQPLQEFFQHYDRVLSLAFSPNNRYLASSSRDKTICLIDLENNISYPIKGGQNPHTDQVHSIAFSPDSNLLVSGGFDRKLKLWDVENRKILDNKNEDQKILTVAFHPKGEIIASAGHNHIITLWKIIDQENMIPIKTFKGHKRAVESVVFTPDGKQLISCSQDQTIKFWEVGGEINISIHTIELGKPYEGMSIFGVFNLDSAQMSAIEELGASIGAKITQQFS